MARKITPEGYRPPKKKRTLDQRINNQGGLGSAYNSSKPPSRSEPNPQRPMDPTQMPRKARSHQAKPGINGYGPGSQFLSYRPGTGASSPPPQPKKKRRRTGDSWIG